MFRRRHPGDTRPGTSSVHSSHDIAQNTVLPFPVPTATVCLLSSRPHRHAPQRHFAKPETVCLPRSSDRQDMCKPPTWHRRNGCGGYFARASGEKRAHVLSPPAALSYRASPRRRTYRRPMRGARRRASSALPPGRPAPIASPRHALMPCPPPILPRDAACCAFENAP